MRPMTFILPVCTFFSCAFFSTAASAASFELSTDGGSAVARIGTQSDFQGSEASIISTDPVTIEFRFPGADLGVEGKRQLYRFEDGAIKNASVAQEGAAGVVRLAFKSKVAAVTADQISIEREAGKIKLELPIFSEAEAAQMSPLSGLKTVAIPASSSNPGSSSEEKAERVSLKVDGPSSAASEKEKSERAQPAAAEAKADSKAKHESEIPVLTSLRAEKKEASGGLEKIVLTLLVLCVVLAGILFGIKRWAERSSKSSKLKTNTKIQILTQHYLGPKKSLAIIQVAGEALLIGITDHNISMLKTLALIDDEVPGVVPKNFSDEFEDDSYSRDDIGGDEESENENFALKGIGEVRDLVSTRLKSLRSN